MRCVHIVDENWRAAAPTTTAVSPMPCWGLQTTDPRGAGRAEAGREGVLGSNPALLLCGISGWGLLVGLLPP